MRIVGRIAAGGAARRTGADGMMDRAQAWLVLYGDGDRSVFVDQATAERYAARVHGTVHALFFGRRRSDDAPDSDE